MTWLIWNLVLCLTYSMYYHIIASICLISGKSTGLFLHVIIELLIVCTRIGISNKYKKNMRCIFLATQMLSLLDGDNSSFPLLPCLRQNLLTNRWYIFTACYQQDLLLLPPGSPYTIRSKILPPEAKMQAHRGHNIHAIPLTFPFLYAGATWGVRASTSLYRY